MSPAPQNDARRIRLDFTPRPWQQFCIENWRRFNVVVLHRQGGKSLLACMQLITQAVSARTELPRFYYIAPKLDQAKRDMWDRLHTKLKPLEEAGGVEFSDSELWVRFKSNGAKIQLRGALDPDSLRGGTLDGVVFDETAQVDPMVWDEIVEPMLMARKGWAIFIGTPKGINLLSVLYQTAQRDTTGQWFCKRWTCYETSALDAAEIERYRESKGPRTFAREFLCDFDAGGDDQLIPLEIAVQASRTRYNPNDPVVSRAPTVLGVDPARFGDDRSVIVKRQGLVCFPPKSWRGIDNMELADRVAREIKDCQPAGVFVDHGAGAGVIDRLRQLGHQVTEVPFGGKALSAGFFNRRVEMWWRMKEWLERGGSIPEDPDLIRELATPTYWFNDNKDQRVLEPKDEIRSRLPKHGSPDIADALALTFATDLPTRLDLQERRLTPQEREARRYHPFARESEKRRRAQ